jgi:hypothetical protein
MGIFFSGGIFSPFFYAYLCDKFEPKYIRSKAYLAALQEFIAATCYFFMYYFKGSFWFAVSFVVIE